MWHGSSSNRQEKEEINFDHLDETIRKFVPSGFSIRDKEHRFSKMIDFDSVRAPFTLQRAQKSIGTLGGEIILSN